MALRASDGRPRWRFNAPGAIKASPSHHDGRVYFADYESSMFALDAATGKVEWRRDVGGPVPGTAVVIGRTVYTSSFKTQRTIGIDAITRRKTFELEQAGYTPVVSDGRRVYVVGYYVLVGLEPAKR